MKYLIWTITLAAAFLVTGCGDGNDKMGGSGLLETDEVTVSAETAGRVMSIAFAEGSRLSAGDTLIVIDPSRWELELASARAGRKVAAAQLESAKVQLAKAQDAEQYARKERDRVARLLQSGTASEKQLDQLEFELSQAILGAQSASSSVSSMEAQLAKIDADIDRIKRQLVDCYPLAPLAGIVTEKYVQVGELLSPGKPIARISNLQTLWVKVYLSAGNFANVTVGNKATVDTEAGGKTYQGEVVWTSEEAEFTPKNVQTEESRTNLVYAVKVRVENADGSLKIGMPVYVTIGD